MPESTDPRRRARVVWCVVRNEQGSFADGWFGWDGSIHEEDQIFEATDLPFRVCPQYTVIVVAVGGRKPSVTQVRKTLSQVVYDD